jgi:hypothetical protein
MPIVWFRVALLNFLVAGLMGVTLRYAFAYEIPWLNFRFWVHAHSHTALLGWLYMGLVVLLVHTFLPPGSLSRPFYRNTLILTQISVIGMMVSFPFQGYGWVAIAFSTVHSLLAYGLCFRFLKDFRHTGLVALFVRAAFLFMILSTFALWAMPAIIMLGKQGSAIYYMAVQFFLHFQFNGWFIFGALALIFRSVEMQNLAIPNRIVNSFFGLLTLSCLLTYALAVAWSNPSALIFAINGAGVIIQLGALVLFLILYYKMHLSLKGMMKGWSARLMAIGLVCFVLKILMQSVVVIPYVATISYTIRNYVIGFMHLILLGMITTIVLSKAMQFNLINSGSKWLSPGLWLLVVGLIGSELLLFLQGTLLWAAMGFMPYYYEGLLYISALIPLGISLIIFSQIQQDGHLKSRFPQTVGI